MEVSSPLLHHLASGFEDLAFVLGQRIKSLRRDFIQDWIDFPADETFRWVGGIAALAAPRCVFGETAGLRP